MNTAAMEQIEILKKALSEARLNEAKESHDLRGVLIAGYGALGWTEPETATDETIELLTLSLAAAFMTLSR